MKQYNKNYGGIKMNKNKTIGMVAVIILVFVSMWVINLLIGGGFKTQVINRMNTETGYETYIMDHWNEDNGKGYELGITGFVKVRDLDWVKEDNGDVRVTALYDIYNKNGKLVGSGYLPEVFK